jgi:tRNA (guanine-N7-)-methyltransferase
MHLLLPHVLELKEEDRSLDLSAIVPEDAPLEIEIGCGNGRFLAARAAKNPTTHYIGVERMMERIRRCSRKAQQGALNNLTFLRVEAGRFVRELLPERRVQSMYLFFPDPWPKRRHH